MVRLKHTSITSIAKSATAYTLATSVGSARLAAATARGTAKVAGSVAGYATEQAAYGAGRAAERATARASALVNERFDAVPRRVGSVLEDLASPGRVRAARRIWASGGRAHIEVKGLTGRGERHRRLASDVTTALRRINGVRWARVNAVTRQVLLAFDEGAVDLDSLIAAVEEVEASWGTEDDDFPRDAPDHPADDAPAAMAAIALGADLAGLGVAAVTRLTRVTPLPRAARIPVLFADTYPRLRHTLEARLGRPHAELLLATVTSFANAASQGAGPIVADSAHHLLRLVEIRSRRAVWLRREEELTQNGDQLPQEAPKHRDRPTSFPEGPIERLGDRMALASLLGPTGMLAFARDPARAADLMLATMPKAGRHGRESYAAVLGWELCRRGVVPMDASALRRLDRVSVIVIDSAALCTTHPRVLSATTLDAELDDQDVWRIAERMIGKPELDSPGKARWASGRWRLESALDDADAQVTAPSAADLDLVDETGERRGRVRIGCVLDPLADAVLVAARESVERVVLTAHDSAEELLNWADEVVPADASVSDYVRGLQRDGHGVLVLSTARHAALEAADVGIAVLHEAGGEIAGPVSWTADLICGPGLTEAWRLLHAVGAARRVSERSCRIAFGGSALGALLATVGGQRPGGSGLPPVYGASLAAVVSAADTALRIGRLEPPEPVMRGTWHAQDARDVYTRLREHRARADQQRERHEAANQHLRLLRDAGSSLAQVPPFRQLVVTPAKGSVELAGAVVEELRDPLTPVLALGAAASAVVGSSVDAILVGGVMAGNAVISATQRLRAEHALHSLLLGERINARRVNWAGPAAQEPDGDDDAWTDGLDEAPAEVIAADQLRIGDVILLRAADIVPADARLIRADELEVDESALTGESLPVVKSTTPTPGADLADRNCMVYEGCAVVAGTGYAVVVSVGAATEAGRAGAVASAAAPAAGIQARLSELTRVALPATGIGGAAVTGLSLLRGVPLRQAVASGVAIAVAAVPEGLPLVATVAQLAAARRLSRKGVLVRSSRTLEAVGRVDTMCFDKTGTLTEGRLAVTHAAAFDEDLPLDSDRARRLMTVAARACPDVEDGAGRPPVHATDAAVLEAARRFALRDDSWKLTEELPFETNRGYSASLGQLDGRPHLALKGAPEVVLERCDAALSGDGAAELTQTRRRAAQETLRRLADQGLRVLAVAQAEPDSVPDGFDDPGELADLVAQLDLTLVGFVAIADTPRENAAAAVRRLAEAGVRVTVITGDHPRTASAVARQLGVPGADQVVTGAELDRLPKREREAKIVSSAVFARVSPEHKVRIVQALQRSGHVVAMTGDGSNDAAAIRLADVGIGVAGRGSVSARTAADLVLTDPDPERIVDAVAEGRALWGSVRDAVSILVGGNGGEIAFTVLGTALGGKAPLGTRQFLLVNMLTDMLPALAVALAPAEANGESEQTLAAGPVEGLRGPQLARDLAARGGATALGATMAWQCGRLTGRQRRAATIGLAALVGTQLGQTLVTGRHSPLVIGTTVASAAALVAVVETPGVSRFFGCTPLGPAAWGVVGACSAAATAAGTFAPSLLEKFGFGESVSPAES
jgi:cation-transporting ATPase I